jgi:hypothetical protein
MFKHINETHSITLINLLSLPSFSYEINRLFWYFLSALLDKYSRNIYKFKSKGDSANGTTRPMLGAPPPKIKEEKNQPNLLYTNIYYITCILRTVAGAVSCERPSACHINIKSTVDQCGVCHCIVKLTNVSEEAIFPTLFQYYMILICQ